MKILRTVLALLLFSILIGNVGAQKLPVADQMDSRDSGTHESGQSHWRTRTFATQDSQSGGAPGQATLVSPSGTTGTNAPTYNWDAVANATWYYLWVNDSTGNRIKQWCTAAGASCPDGTGTCSVWAWTALAAGSAKWWIQTWNDYGYGPWSDAKNLTVEPGDLPGQATLVSPSGTIDTNAPTYTWDALANATWYYLWVNDSTGNRIKQWYRAAEAGCRGGTGTCSAAPDTALAAGPGEWWIQVYNSSGLGPWSVGKEFRVGPGQAEPISPSGAIDTATPPYTWKADPHSTWYYLRVRRLYRRQNPAMVHGGRGRLCRRLRELCGEVSHCRRRFGQVVDPDLEPERLRPLERWHGIHDAGITSPSGHFAVSYGDYLQQDANLHLECGAQLHLVLPVGERQHGKQDQTMVQGRRGWLPRRHRDLFGNPGHGSCPGCGHVVDPDV